MLEHELLGGCVLLGLAGCFRVSSASILTIAVLTISFSIVTTAAISIVIVDVDVDNNEVLNIDSDIFMLGSVLKRSESGDHTGTLVCAGIGAGWCILTGMESLDDMRVGDRLRYCHW